MSSVPSFNDNSFQAYFAFHSAVAYDPGYFFTSPITVDLTDFTQMRISTVVIQVGVGTEKIKAQYGFDYSTYSDFTEKFRLDSLGLQRTGWITIPDAARTVVALRIGGGEGDSLTQLETTDVVVEFRR